MASHHEITAQALAAIFVATAIIGVLCFVVSYYIVDMARARALKSRKREFRKRLVDRGFEGKHADYIEGALDRWRGR